MIQTSTDIQLVCPYGHASAFTYETIKEEPASTWDSQTIRFANKITCSTCGRTFIQRRHVTTFYFDDVPVDQIQQVSEYQEVGGPFSGKLTLMTEKKL